MSTPSGRLKSEAWRDMFLCVQMAQAQLNILTSMQMGGSSLGVPSDSSCQLHVMEVVTSAAISHLEACRLVVRRLQGKTDQISTALVTSSSEDIQSGQVEEEIRDPIGLSTTPRPFLDPMAADPTTLKGDACVVCGMQEGRMGRGGREVEMEVGGGEVGEYVEWAKYGRRQLAGASFLRHYYRCRHFRNGCPAKRFEDIALVDNCTVVGGGREGGEHNHAPSLKFRPRKRKMGTAAAGGAAEGEHQVGDLETALDAVGIGCWDIGEGSGEGFGLEFLEGEGEEERVENDDTSLHDLLNFDIVGLEDVYGADIWP